MEKDEVKEKQTWQTEAGYDAMACQIVKLAIQDYINARKKKDHATAAALEHFFRSEWCQLLCNIDGEVLIESAEKMYNELKQGRRKNAKF